MANPKVIDTGKSLMERVLALIPEEQRASVQTAIMSNDQALHTLGEHTLLRNESDRLLAGIRRREAELDAIATQQQTWYEQITPKLTAAEEILARGGNPNPNPNPPVAPEIPKDLVRTGDLNKLVEAERTGLAQFAGYLATLGMRHFKEFGEVLDVNELILKDPRVASLGVEGVYNALVADRRTAAGEAAIQARIRAGVEEGVAAERAKLTSQPPYPTTGPSMPSPLDAIEANMAGADRTVVDAATAEYLRLVNTEGAQAN